MKSTFIAFFAFLLLSSCRDKTTVIIPEKYPLHVFPSHFVQNVLLENIVSESNSQSVYNSILIKELQQKYGKRLLVCNMHKQDWLEDTYTNDFISMLGGTGTFPRAAINRLPGLKTSLGEDTYTLLHPDNWDITIERGIGMNAPLALGIETEIVQSKGNIKLYIAHKEAIATDTRIGLYLVEDEVKSIFQQGAGPDFKHQHVMKNAILGIEGDPVHLSEAVAEGEILTRYYGDIDLKFYKTEHLYVIAFVFNVDKDFRKMTVYNAAMVKLGGIRFWND